MQCNVDRLIYPMNYQLCDILGLTAFCRTTEQHTVHKEMYRSQIRIWQHHDNEEKNNNSHFFSEGLEAKELQGGSVPDGAFSLLIGWLSFS